MSYQDWTPVIINKSKNEFTVKRPGPSEEAVRLRKLENEEYVLPKVSIALQQQIRDARALKGWTQKELAARLNMKPSIINGYESGSIVPDNPTLQRLSRALGVSLKLK
jgi:putative transcription factor